MKKLLLVIITGLSLFIGASFADFTSYSVTPADQVAISGSLVGRNIHIANSTGDAYVKVMLPWTQSQGIVYRNASQLPINNSLLQLGVGNEPIFFVASGATLNLVVTGKVVTSSRGFTQMGIKFPASNDSGFAGIFTSAIATISPIADLAISKILTGAFPIFSGDQVQYIVTIQNIGSTFATGIQLADSFPIPLLGLPSAIVNGNPLAYNLPITLPNIFVRDLGGAYILTPGQIVTFHISATLMQQVAAGTAFANTAQASTASSELTTGNNKVTVTGTTVAPADLYIHKTMLPFTGFAAGSTVVYILNYGNSGSAIISGVVINDMLPTVVSATPTMRVAGALQPGQTGQIIVTGTLNTTLTGGTTFANIATIGGNGVEQTTGNNSSIVTGTIASLPNITLDIQANNLTRPQYDTTQYGASGPNSMILAVSGDLIQLTINYGNNGNTAANNGSISLAGLGGFVSYGTFNGTLGNLNIGQTGTIVITGIVGPQNYSGFIPTATLTYNSTQTVSDTVKIQEPFVCGDGLITRTEPCDTAGQIGLTISGQVCENHGGFCVAVTKDIVNTACLDYRFTLGSGRICSSVQFPITEDVGQCKELIVHGSSIILADESNGHYRGTASFTCDAQNGVASTIAIDCGNGEIHTGTNTSSFNATCNYNETSIPTDRTVQCYVDGTTQSDCQQKMIVDKAEFGFCGDGQLDAYEDCDLGKPNDQEIGAYLDADKKVANDEYTDTDKTYTCHNCDVRENDVPVSPTLACFSLNENNVSVQDNEYLPFRWKVDLMGSKVVDSCDDGDEGKVIRDSLMCEFRIFNGEHQESEGTSPSYAVIVNGEKTVVLPCNVDMWKNGNEDDIYDATDDKPLPLFDYFYKQRFTNNIRSLQKPSGRYFIDMKDVALDKVYGEYNIALYQVRYNYCHQDENNHRQELEATPIDRVCESDFTVTRPYLAQKSSFGLTPASTDINLDGYRSIFGDPIIKKTDLDKIMVLDADTYKGGSNVNSLMTSFISKYDKLAVAVDKNRIDAFKGNDDITSVKIVPQQKIYIIKGKTGTTLTLNAGDFSDTPFTLVTRNINLVVQGDMQANGMFLVDKGTISFQEPVAKKCAATQKVQGIFITNQGFAADPEDLSNNDMSKDRCNQGGLYVKGVLIGNNVADLVASRRSQLNHWFYGTDSNIERRNEIFNGAAVLIEYSPSLRTALPPGASEFTKALDVYKK